MVKPRLIRILLQERPLPVIIPGVSGEGDGGKIAGVSL